MGKKHKPKSHKHRKREKSRNPGKRLPTDLVIKGGGLPEDVVYEILVRLPVKSLTKFRCVCKQWHSFISHPSFQHDHYLIRSKQEPLYLITREEFDYDNRTNVLHFSTYDINQETLVQKFSKTLPLQFYTDMLVMQSCQGLVCLVGLEDRKHIILCNPSTRKLIVLPPTNEASHCVAFGFSDSKKELKLVRFFRRQKLDETKTFCEVFSLNTSEWREAKCPPPQDQRFSSRAYFLHGSIHLEPLCAMGPIHAFNIETEEYRVIPFPEVYDSPEMECSQYPHFNEFSGFLCLTMYYERRYEVWLLKDYNNAKWVKEYTIDDFYHTTPKAILGDGNLLLQTYDDESDGWLYCYNPRDGTYTRKLVYHTRAKAALYVGSLFALGR